MSASPYGRLLTLAWPIVLARATQSVVGFTDALFVAPLGEAPLAAVTTGAMNAMGVLILPMGTVFIVQSFGAQLRGRGQLGAIRRYAWYGLLVAALAALASLAAIPLVPRLVAWTGYEPQVAEHMTAYVQIRLLSVGFAVGAEALGNWYGGIEKTLVAMIAGVVTMVVNVAVCAALVSPHFGLPGYGVRGAAWASVVGSAAGFAVCVALFLRGAFVPPEVKAGDGAPLRTRELLRVLRFGAPNGVNWFLEFAAFIVFLNLVVARLGTTVLAAFNVVMQLNAISFMPAFGLASAGAILVGEAIGRRAHEEVWPHVKRTAVAAGAWMGTVGVVYVAAPRPLMSLFDPGGDGGGALLASGAVMLMLAAVWQLLDAVSLTVGEALRAAGDTTWCMVARIVLAWFVFTPLAWIALRVLHGGVVTMMVALVAYIGALALTLAGRFASGRWRSIQLVEPELPESTSRGVA